MVNGELVVFIMWALLMGGFPEATFAGEAGWVGNPTPRKARAPIHHLGFRHDLFCK